MMQLTKKVYHFFFTAVFLLLSQVNYAQFDIPAKPSRSEQTLVYDYANLLDGGQRKQLERKLIDYSNETSTQILVIVIPSLQGENIGLLGPRTSLGNPFQCLTTLTVKNFFLTSNLNFPC